MSSTPLRDNFLVSVPQFSVVPMACDSASVAEGAALVVSGTNDNACALPAAGEAAGFIGFALLAGPTTTGGVVNVCVGPFYLAIANGTITRGDRLVIASATGDVKTAISTTANNASIVGVAMESASNGQRVRVRITSAADFVSSPQTLVKAFVAGTGGSTAGCVMVADTGTVGQAILPAGADPTDSVLGIALNTAVATGTVFVAMWGVALGKAAAAGFTVGQTLAVSASTGVLKAAAPLAGANTYTVGLALDTAGSGQLKNVFVRPFIMQG